MFGHSRDKEGKRDLLNERIEGNKKPVPILGPLQVLKVMWALDKIQFVSGMLGKALSECPPDNLSPSRRANCCSSTLVINRPNLRLQSVLKDLRSLYVCSNVENGILTQGRINQPGPG